MKFHGFFSEPMPAGRRIAVAVAWCWLSAFVSCIVMADPGSISIFELPTTATMSSLGMILGPGFFPAGLCGRGVEVPGESIVISYIAYAILLWGAIGPYRPKIRYACLAIIALASFVAWQGLKNSL